MSIYGKLRDELNSDPLGRGYSTMTNQEVLDSLLSVDRTVNVKSISGQSLFSVTVDSEFTALTDAKKQMWVSFTTNDGVDPWEQANVDFVTWIFGGGSTTISNLAALRTKTISRAEEIGIDSVKLHHVEHVRG